MLEKEFWHGSAMSAWFAHRKQIKDRRLAALGMEFFGQPYVGRTIIVNQFGRTAPMVVVKVNYEQGSGEEPTFECRQDETVVSSVSFDQIVELLDSPIKDKDSFDKDGFTVNMMAAPGRISLIGPMLELAARSGITSLKDLFLLAGRKAVTRDGSPVIIDHFAGPSPSGVDLMDMDPATPMFMVKDRWGQWVAYSDLSDLRLVDRWEDESAA
jgi:hypothetical protein